VKYNVAELIRKKRNGYSLTRDELTFFIQGYVKGEIPDEQVSAWLMAVYFQSLSAEETLELEDIMQTSGDQVDLRDLKLPTCDKHSTGGVGDKTSFILGPIVACCDVIVPMMSGRGLGHTGGTLDKLESIPGFRTNLSIAEFKRQLTELGISFIGQTERICPADKKLYALRDVTGTVESIPLICASILSKKLAEGARALVFDVKFGSGAFMKSLEDAKKLADNLGKISALKGVPATTFLTSMEQPLGCAIGNALEVNECLEILKGNRDDSWSDTYQLSLFLAGAMLEITGKASSLDEGFQLAGKLISSGKAYEKFENVVKHQGGQLSDLKVSSEVIEVKSAHSGTLTSIDVEQAGYAAIDLGAGRKSLSDKIDHSVGIEWFVKLGQKVSVGEVIAKLYHRNNKGVESAQRRLFSSLRFDEGNFSRVKPYDEVNYYLPGSSGSK